MADRHAGRTGQEPVGGRVAGGRDAEQLGEPGRVPQRPVVAAVVHQHVQLGALVGQLVQQHGPAARFLRAVGVPERVEVATLDLDAAHPLPVAPWFEPGASWSVRRVLPHVIAETAQHAGHADILRESIDGAKTMG